MMLLQQDTQAICPICHSSQIEIFFKITDVPVHCNIFWPSQQQAMVAPKSDIRLGFCKSCGHVFNTVFDSKKVSYAPGYENSQHFSPTFKKYAETTARHLIDRYQLKNALVMEIGCGQGEFLRLLCKLSDSRGMGFDPCFDPDHEEMEDDKITILQTLFPENFQAQTPDLICCRHVLEHVKDLVGFLSSIRRAMGRDRQTILFIEVPNGLDLFRNQKYWDIIYEHHSYFTDFSLTTLFETCGFHVCSMSESFQGQFLVLEADVREEPSPKIRDSLKDIVSDHIHRFANAHATCIRQIKKNMDQMASRKQRVMLWGGGSKGVSFLNALKISDQIPYVVDINQRKQGLYVAGTGQKIVPPSFIKDYAPDVIIIMNSIYEAEIREQVKDLGIRTAFLVL